MSLLAIESTYEKCGKFEICKNPVFENTGACALHCLDEKIENTNSYLSEFHNLFMGYLFEKIKNINSIKSSNDHQKLIKTNALSSIRLEGLRFDSFKDNNDLKSVINDSNLLIEDVFFPGNITGYIIKEFQKVYFKNCIFRENLGFDKSCIFYSSCIFYEKIEIKADTEYLYTKDKKDISYSPVISSPNEDEYKYKECIFESDVSIIGQKKINYIYYRLFRNCDFKKNINIDNVKVRSDFITISDIFEYIKIIDSKYDYKDLICKYKNIYSFNDLSIKNCNFDSSFKINGIDIDYIEKNKKIMDNYNKDLSNEIKGIFSINSLIIEETKFDEKFELKNCIVKNINFEDSNIKGIFDVYKSSFIKAKFYKSIFEEFAAFEYVIFGDSLIENRTDFIYVTFKDFSNFRDTHFKSGLSFSRANLKQEPNFLNTKINAEYTDRETFRIIKNSFDDVGNKLEANKFFAEEMKAYKKELDGIKLKEIEYVKSIKENDRDIKYKKTEKYKGSRRSRWVFNANDFISEFGENYLRPIFILTISVVVYTVITLWNKYYFKKNPYFTSWDWLNNTSWSKWYFESHEYFLSCEGFDIFSGFWNELAINILPFRVFIKDRNGIEFISLFFYIWFAILIWQIIIAVKRHTQR